MALWIRLNGEQAFFYTSAVLVIRNWFDLHVSTIEDKTDVQVMLVFIDSLCL